MKSVFVGVVRTELCLQDVQTLEKGCPLSVSCPQVCGVGGGGLALPPHQGLGGVWEMVLVKLYQAIQSSTSPYARLQAQDRLVGIQFSPCTACHSANIQ